MSLLLGVNAFAGTGDAAGRQSRALERWRGLHGVSLANLQWGDDVFALDGFETALVRLRERLADPVADVVVASLLLNDSLGGRNVSQVLDRLAQATRAQLRISFSSREAAEAYARANGIAYEVEEPAAAASMPSSAYTTADRPLQCNCGATPVK